MLSKSSTRLLIPEHDVCAEVSASEVPPQIMLQRNKHSIAPVFNNALFGLTIVCAVLGVVTNLSGGSEAQSDQMPTLQTG